MDTTLVPVTEAEMRGIAERLISTVVGYSRQASELASLTSRVTELAEQVSALRGENATLKTERDNALSLAVENETKLNDARRHRDDLIGRVNALNDTIISGNSRVKDLEGLLTSARLESEDWQRKHDRQSRELDQVRTDLHTARERRDAWMIRAEDAERALAEATAKLEAIQKQVSDVFGLVKPPQAAEVPAPADPIPGAGQSSTQENSASPDSTSRPWWENPEPKLSSAS